MRSLLVHVHNDSCLDARLKLAADLARSFDGFLTCLHATPYEFIMPNDVYGTLVTQMIANQRSDAAEMRAKLSAHFEQSTIPWEWMEQSGTVAARLYQQASLSDLVIVGACDEETGEPGYSSLPGELAIESRVPVMVVPTDCAGYVPASPAVVAWKGTPESAHALRAAVPLLAKASSVHLVCSAQRDESDYEIAPQEAQNFLTRHSITSTIEWLERTEASVAADINAYAARIDAGLIVMGAFGHSRLRQRVFGGVTRNMLSAVERPLFLCH
ncbi:universal stress protein [Altererythrobacter indicus]|uniref:Universal stress protein n=1 Tax=Altericroceibacterium indicum TaxID=374177 RepID=A0A845ACK2_9SPHN|nr:universal stress protein [Altericroceibacterium indicum]MXP27119.1 universal stress protein [Altericroceibacterium indicum]